MIPAMTAHPAKGWTVFPERREDMAGAVLGGRFEVEKRIGRGGMAEVFLSKDLLLHGLATVKVLREGNTDARRRFADEGRLLANLRDPHLVRVLAVGEAEDGAPYMALEYLDGPSLEGRVRGGPLMWRELVDLAGWVAGALAVLPRVGISHRDVKSSNIVQLDGATGRPVVKIWSGRGRRGQRARVAGWRVRRSERLTRRPAGRRVSAGARDGLTGVSGHLIRVILGRDSSGVWAAA